jgi:hypothetical protein
MELEVRLGCQVVDSSSPLNTVVPKDHWSILVLYVPPDSFLQKPNVEFSLVGSSCAFLQSVDPISFDFISDWFFCHRIVGHQNINVGPFTGTHPKGRHHNFTLWYIIKDNPDFPFPRWLHIALSVH